MIACLAQSGSVGAFSPRKPEPAPWFAIQVQIEARSLPPGIEYRDADFADVLAGYFTNSGATPLYLVTRPDPPPDWVRTLPATVVPKVKAVSGQGFRMGPYGTWERSERPGIAVFDLALSETRNQNAGFEALGYLGKQSFQIRGRMVGTTHRKFVLDTPLPKQVRLVALRDADYVIVNDGSIPFYVGVKHARPVGWVTEVPYGYLATHKVVAGKAFSKYAVGGNSADGWHESRMHDAGLRADGLENYVPGIVLNQIRRDGRPPNARPPEPEPFELTVFHGTQKVVLRGRLRYELDPNYNPTAGQPPPRCVPPPGCADMLCANCVTIQSTPRIRVPRQPATY